MTDGKPPFILLTELLLQPKRAYGSIGIRLPGQPAAADSKDVQIGFAFGADGKLLTEWPDDLTGLELRSEAGLQDASTMAFVAARGDFDVTGEGGRSFVFEYRHADKDKTVDVSSRRELSFGLAAQGAPAFPAGRHSTPGAGAGAPPLPPPAFDILARVRPDDEWVKLGDLIDATEPSILPDAATAQAEGKPLFYFKVMPANPGQRLERMVWCTLVLEFLATEDCRIRPLRVEPVLDRGPLDDQEYGLLSAHVNIGRDLAAGRTKVRYWNFAAPVGLELAASAPPEGWFIGAGNTAGIEAQILAHIVISAQPEALPEVFPIELKALPVEVPPPGGPHPLSIVALDIGSSTISAAVRRGVPRDQEVPSSAREIEDVRFGELIDRELQDKDRPDFGNAFFIPTAMSVVSTAPAPTSSQSWTITKGYDPAYRRFARNSDVSDGSCEKVRARLQASGRPMEVSLPARGNAIAKARREARGVDWNVTPLRDAGQQLVALDPKTLICRSAEIGERFEIATRAKPEDASPANMFSCLIEELVRTLLPLTSAGRGSGPALGRDWLQLLHPEAEGEIILALAHPGSIGARAVRAYRKAATDALARLWPDRGLSGLPTRRFSVELVPEAIAMAESLRIVRPPGAEADSPGTMLLDCFRKAEQGQSSALRRLLVVDIGHGTTDVCLVACDGKEITAGWPLVSFAMPVAGRAFHQWIAKDVAAVWKRLTGRDDAPWQVGSGFNLAARVDDALRRWTGGDEPLLIRIDASERVGFDPDNLLKLCDEQKTKTGPSVHEVEMGGGATQWLGLRAIGSVLQVLQSGLTDFAGIVKGRLQEDMSDSTTLVAVTGRGALSPLVMDVFGAAFGAARTIDAGAILSGGSSDRVTQSVALKQAVARGAAMVARDRALLRRMDSSAPEPGRFALVFGEADEYGQFQHVSDLRPLVGDNPSGNTFTRPAAASTAKCYVARMIGVLRADNIGLLMRSPDGMSIQDLARRELQQAMLSLVAEVEFSGDQLDLAFADDGTEGDGESAGLPSILVTLPAPGSKWVAREQEPLPLTDEGCFI